MILIFKKFRKIKSFKFEGECNFQASNYPSDFCNQYFKKYQIFFLCYKTILFEDSKLNNRNLLITWKETELQRNKYWKEA